jgi:RHS repeat-associated protein
VYDLSSSPCGLGSSFPGKLVQKIDARSNTTCYTYDGAGRNTTVSYFPVGLDTKVFVYDSATVNGAVMSNTTNRMAEAYTYHTVSGSQIKDTDFGFSYTPAGKVTDVYEITPNSGGYYHTSASYFENGAVATLSGLPYTSISPSAFTFALDAMGREYTVTESANCPSSCKTVLAGASYTIGKIVSLQYGSGDTDVFNYNATTNRLSSYTLNAGAKKITDNVTWQTAGLLSKQAFIDTVDSANAQTCNYGYDAQVRLTSVNCGSNWNQTFSYDVFGNISKSATVGTNFGALYNTKNQITNYSASYDVSGDLTGINLGTSLTYTWDQAGRLATTGGTTLIYDAFDRVVDNGVIQFLYSPIGKTAVMVGQSLSRLELPLPKGAKAIYNTVPNPPMIEHADLLGSGVLGSDYLGNVTFDRFFAPFGEEYDNDVAYGQRQINSFTGQTQDLDVNLYDFQLREQSFVQGRWLNPDPSGLSAATLIDPQTLNRYAYVRGSATGSIDANGLRGMSPYSWWGELPTFGGEGGQGPLSVMEDIGYDTSEISYGFGTACNVSCSSTSEDAAVSTSTFAAPGTDSFLDLLNSGPYGMGESDFASKPSPFLVEGAGGDFGSTNPFTRLVENLYISLGLGGELPSVNAEDSLDDMLMLGASPGEAPEVLATKELTVTSYNEAWVAARRSPDWSGGGNAGVGGDVNPAALLNWNRGLPSGPTIPVGRDPSWMNQVFDLVFSWFSTAPKQ